MSSYQALYRKWRPMRFDDVVGQRQVSDTLKTAIKNGRIAHAYLFCGTRGTGKTSTAKIFSRAVNCESPIDGEPCNECPTCRGILNGSIPDVYEMDAASNRGVDNIRDIRDEVIYTPVGCGKKIYIIDEVHMLTEEAFNALLKTIEEPPPHAIFILATTEPQRIPQTVLSRCQRFDFRRITVDDIASRLTKISTAEGIDITPDAVELVAELGDGSMRDAISLLDRCSAFGGEQLTCAKVSDIVGIVSSDKLFEIADSIADDSSDGALTAASEILRTGKEPQSLLESMSEHFRALLLCKASEHPAALLEKTETAAAKYADQAQRFSAERLLFSIKALGEALSQAKWLSSPKIAVETAVVKLCSPMYSTDLDALLARIERLETTVANLSSGITTAKASPAPASEPAAASQDSDAPLTPPWDIDEAPPAAPKAAPTETKPTPSPAEASRPTQDWDFWAEALNEIKKESRLLYAFLYNATPALCGNTVEIEVDGEVAYGKIATPGGIEYLSKLFSRVSGSTLGAKVYIKGQREAAADSGQPSIHDLAKKKELFGDAMEID